MRQSVMMNFAAVMACLFVAVASANEIRRLASSTNRPHPVNLLIVGCHHENGNCPLYLTGSEDYGNIMPYPFPHISIADGGQVIKTDEDYDHYKKWIKSFAQDKGSTKKWKPSFTKLPERMHGDGTNKKYPYEVTQSGGTKGSFTDKTIVDITRHIKKYDIKANGGEGKASGFHITVPEPWVKEKVLTNGHAKYLDKLNWYLYDSEVNEMHLLHQH
jgi:hypothetical protein